MMHATPMIPRPVSWLFEHLPTQPPSFVLTRVLNQVLRDVIGSGSLEPLHGKRIAIRVTDAGLRLHFTLCPTGFTLAGAEGDPDLTISATLHDFYLLATRREDPDTLFFNRRLVIEGDTELGLLAKNTLDGVELPSLSSLHPGRVLEYARMRLLG